MSDHLDHPFWPCPIEKLKEERWTFFYKQHAMLHNRHLLENRGFVAIVYGEPKEKERYGKPTADLLKTFTGPFDGIMKSKAVRWISTKDLEEHNKEAKEIAIEWFVVDSTFINTFFDWLGRDLKEIIARHAFMPKEQTEPFVRDFLVLEEYGGPYLGGRYFRRETGRRYDGRI